MFKWAIPGKLARGRRPGVEVKNSQVPKSTVNAWIKEAKDSYGIRSIVCLLDDKQLKYYEKLPSGLVSYYREEGFRVVHISAPNMRKPPLSDLHLKKVWSAYKNLQKPVLVHCSAGIGRTGAAVRHIKKQLGS